MRNTKIMLSIIVTFMFTWILLSTIGYLLSDATFKEVSSSVPVGMLMLLFGWIPAAVVAYDVDERLK